MDRRTFLLGAALAPLGAAFGRFESAVRPPGARFAPGARVLLDVYNCYPYDSRWTDRIDRALSTGTPLAIEQDLVWFRDPATGVGRSLLGHGGAMSGLEPTLRDHFFERIRPLIEAALGDDRREDWPLVTLNLDFKNEEPAHLSAVWSLLTEYRPWLTTASRQTDVRDVQPLDVGPVLVLTGDSDAQRRVFYEAVPVGEELLVFGAVHRRRARISNYRRWSNHPWTHVEPAGQAHAGAWTAASAARLDRLVRSAHDAGLWIRFYTLDGHDPRDTSGGWAPGYNFGSEKAARERWLAAIHAGVDFIAVDEYETFAATLHALA